MAAVATGVEERLLIGGEWVEAGDGRRFDVTDPGTGEVVGSVPDAGESEVDAAIDAAAAALDEWKAQPALNRARILRRAADLIRERRDRIALVMTSEQGKPLAEAAGEVEYAASFLEWFGGEAERVYGQVVPPMNAANRVLVLRQPVGVTAAITPWNFPAAMMTRKLGPAMAAGCTSIVKPASATPLTAALILRAIEDAGTPPGVVNLITSRSAGMVAERLFTDSRVRKISFTGSTEVGKDLIRRSADQIKRLSLELGGHAPYLIFDDADLEEAVDGLIASKFRNAGQTCVCANRVYIQSGIYDSFVGRLTEKVSQMVVGHGTTDGVSIGPLIDERAVDKADEHVQDAIAHGARLVVGGERLDGAEYAGGSYYAPTVLDGVTPEMLISTEETFGPVAGLTRFETEEEAIRVANDSIYGLAAYFHTRDYARLLRVAEKLEYGIVGANSGIISAANAPFGGIKESGYGREGGAFGIDEYVDVKYVLVGGVGVSDRIRYASSIAHPGCRGQSRPIHAARYPDAVALFSSKPAAPAASDLRRERRALLLLREDRLRELGGLTLEMYRRDHFNETLIIERCAELVAIEARASEIDALLQGARGLRRRGAAICACGAPLLIGARFCPSCGRSLIDEAAVVEAEG